MTEPGLQERLAFREALRESACLAQQYAQVELDLPARSRFDREAYTDAKALFIVSVLVAWRAKLSSVG